MDVTYIAAAPALVRLRDEHHQHPDRMVHRADAARLRRERSYVRRLLRRVRIRRTFDDLASVAPPTARQPPESRQVGAFG